MVTAIVLAAGESRRMGQLKPLLPLGSTTVLGAVVTWLKASPVGEILVVTGHRGAEIAAAVQRMADDPRSTRPGLALRAVANPDYRRGMLASIQRGLVAASPAAEWFLIALADQPGIPPAVVAELLAAAQAGGAAVYLPTFEGRRGHPVLVHRSFQEAVAGLPAEGGLRQLWQQCPEVIRHVPVDSPLVLQDMDTPADYARVVREEG